MKRRILLVAGLLLILLGAGFIFLRRPASNFLPIASINPKCHVSSWSTFGTNHVYYRGGSFERTISGPLSKSLFGLDSEPSLQDSTAIPSTMIWVRLKHSDYKKPPGMKLVTTPSGSVQMPVVPHSYPEFQMRLINPTGAQTVLTQGTYSESYKPRFFLGGWVLPGKLEAHRGSTLRIEMTNGTEIVIFRAP